MKIAEEQKKQLIVLGCLIVFVLGYAVIRIVGSGTHAQTRQTEPAAKTSDARTDAAKPPAAVVTEPVTVAADLGGGVSAARDPFIPQIGESAVAAPKMQSLNLSKMNAGTLPGLNGLKPLDLSRQITVTRNGESSPLEQEPDPRQMFSLTGVIQGSINVAIIRGPDNARYIVREGQVIDGRYRVVHVARNVVSMSYKNKPFLLPLGGSDANKGAQ
ncbi:MAG: hypothetical protein KBC96_00840 [Armatimonadetes bacterium]|nr:hypothetical protein [Armatimonadota bacterium]